MAKKTAPPPIDISDAISNGLAEQAALEQQKVRQQAVLDQLESERASIHSDMQQCAQSRESIKAKIATTQRETEKQEGYVSLWKGASGISELQALKSTMEALLDQLHQVMSHDTAMTARSTELDTAIATARTDLAAVTKHIETVSSARQRLIHENSANVYDECSSIYAQRQRYEQECRDALAAAEEMTAVARGASLQRLSQWPDVKRRFEAESMLNDDATSETLQAAVSYADALLHAGAQMEQQHAGSVCVQVWYELVLDAQTLQALTNGDSAPLRAIRDRQYSLLYEYRQKQARV